MSNAIARAMQDIAIESGEVHEDASEFHEDLNELLVSESQVAKEPSITDQVEEAQKATDVTEQLDELADRADEVDQIESPALAQVAVESLHREFQCIMRANQLPFNASSFESTYIAVNQAKGLAADARRVAGYSRQVSTDILGYSEEAGSIIKFIRRDEKRLVEAQAVLNKAIPAVARISDQLKEHPVMISHSGSALFMTVADKPAFNFKAAVETEVAQMHKLHDAIVEAIAAVQEGAHAFAANPGASAETLLPASKFAKLNAFAEKHHFMGNRTIVATEDKNSPVMNFRRIDESKLQGWNATKSVAWVPMAAIGWTAATMGIIVIGSAVTGGALPAVIGATIGAKGLAAGIAARSIRSGYDNYQANKNQSDAKSAAGAFDFLKALSELSTIGKMAEFKFDETKVFGLLDSVLKGDHRVEGMVDEKSQHASVTKTYGAFEDTIGNIAAAIDCLYEQAIYDVVEGAKLAAQVTKHF